MQPLAQGDVNAHLKFLCLTLCKALQSPRQGNVAAHLKPVCIVLCKALQPLV